MVWALLALLGIPLWFIAALLLAIFRNRKIVLADPLRFQLKRQNPKGWSRARSSGRWVSDVLVLHKGLALVLELP